MAEKVQESWAESVAAALGSVASYDPSIRDKGQVSLKEEIKFFGNKFQESQESSSEPPSELSAAEAEAWPSGYQGVDFRPFLFDKATGQYSLVDSGSQVSAQPPDPGDKPIPDIMLKAVNGSKLKCFGYKEVVIKIGRKEIRHEFIKADVVSPVIGYDFLKKHRLHLGFNQFGQSTLVDPKSQCTTVLKHKPLPFLESRSISSLQLVHLDAMSGPEVSPVPELAARVFEVAAMKSLTPGKEDDQSLDQIPAGPYRELLKKFPGLLKYDFKSEEPKMV